jgi:hypothetical protein
MASVDFDSEAKALDRYFQDGEARARTLGNRGPVRFTAGGKLAPDIVDSYLKFGFYIFEGVFGDGELTELRTELHDMLDRLPTRRESPVDHKGRPALGVGLPVSPLHWSKPLGDPMGGSAEWTRSPVKMIEGRAAANLPEEIVYIIHGALQFSDAALRAYAHPSLLAISATVNGDDFVPFSEGYVIKKPGEGAAFAWHQDGTTHWDSPDWDALIHGFNFMIQLYTSTPANGLWYVPGTHAQGKCDIPAMVERAGSILLPEAVPLVCNPGDVAISNRQILHGSFANTSDDWRVSLNFGFHRRKSILGVRGRTCREGETYDAERICKRAEMIGYAIDARRQRFPEEAPFVYQPHRQSGAIYRWNEETRGEIKAYNLRDLNI